MANKKIKLKDHQTRVIDRITSPEQSGLLVYHEVGSGKTITAIEAANRLKMNSTVITPASLRTNFVKEVDKVKADKSKFDVTSYERYQKTPEKHSDNEMLIMDEAHRIRNAATKRAQAIANNSEAYKKRLLLTGTPIQNHPSEIAPIMNVVAGKQIFPVSEKAFNKLYLPTVEIRPNIIDHIFSGARPYKKTVPANLALFRSKIRNLVDYHKNNNTADFPEVNTFVSKINMTKQQADTYKYYEGKLPAHLKFVLKKNLAPNKKDAAALNRFLSATRQISNSPNKFLTDDKTSVSPKILMIADRISQTDSPTLVYSNFLDSGIRPLSKLLSERGIKNDTFTGELNDTQKSELVKKYNSGKIKALLVSSSGGEGLDLKNTRSVHIMEPHWNDSKIEQVIGRAVRYKSHEALPAKDRNVSVYKYLADIPSTKTADEYLYEMSKAKTELNNKFLNILKEEGTK